MKTLIVSSQSYSDWPAMRGEHIVHDISVSEHLGQELRKSLEFSPLAGGGRGQMLVVWCYYVKITHRPSPSPSFLTRLDGRMEIGGGRWDAVSLLSPLSCPVTLQCLPVWSFSSIQPPDTPGWRQPGQYQVAADLCHKDTAQGTQRAPT